MELRRGLLVFFLALITPILAKDGPIDWSKAPGGGYDALRVCAQRSFAWDGNWMVNTILGCKILSCLCRPDLIEQAQEYIKNKVLSDCGKDANVDVDMAVKMYNDYCSANDFPIPGYTYIITQTAQPQPSTGSVAAVVQTTAVGSAVDVPTIPTGTGVKVVTIGVTATVVNPARVTIVQSSAPPRIQSHSWLHNLFRLVMVPIDFVLALPETIVVPYTSSLPPPAVTLVVTALASNSPTSVIKSTKTVEYVPQPEVTYNPDASTTTSTSSNSGSISGRSANSGPTTLEIVGIIMGIIMGLVTTVATVWMCTRSHRRITM